MPTLIAAGFFTSWIFVKREQRVPNPQERKHLILGSIASNLIISTILVVIALFFIAFFGLMFYGLHLTDEMLALRAV